MIVTLQRAVELIRSGEVVAFPTETVYGLGADAKNIQAIRKTFSIKRRPKDNPLIVHISDIDQVKELATDIPPIFLTLSGHFWPGPLTLVLKKHNSVPDAVTGGLNTVAIRMPNHALALDLIRQTGPLTAPSANLSGKPSPTKPEHIMEDHGDQLPVLDGGASEIGLESTVLDLTSDLPTVLRPGAITAAMIEDVAKVEVQESTGRAVSSFPKSPGVKYTHYKPHAAVKWLDSVPAEFDPNTFYILHSAIPTVNPANVFNCEGNFNLLAKSLYDFFRTADHLEYSQILIEALPENSSHPLIAPLKNRISKAVST
jgi:L-threonylcarbamoyladenylate synthase